MKNVERDAYLAYSLSLKAKEVELIKSFASWLPNNIIDCHVHCNLPDHVLDIPEKSYGHMLSTFPSFSLEESEHLITVLFPGKSVRSLRFANVFSGINHKEVNLYLLENSKRDDRVALFGLPEDIEYTISCLRDPRVSALKMYYSYIDPTATKIYEVFKPEILEEAQSLEVPIILHVPKMIVQSREDVKRLVKDFPNLKVSIAHLGSTKFVVPGLEETYRDLANFPNISMDTALNPSAQVVELALHTFGEDRVMFGSDAPLNLIRSRAFIDPDKGQRLITEYLYHWVDQNEHRKYAHLAEGVIHSHWLSMKALRQAIESYPGKDKNRIKDKVFFLNAKLFFGF